MPDPVLLRPTDGPEPPSRPTAYDFAAVFDHAGLGMVIADVHGRILRVNEAYARLVGRTAPELVGQTTAGFTHPDDLALAPLALENMQQPVPPSTTFEKRYLRPDGSIVWARITLATAYDDPAGRFVIGTAENITEQQEIREELIETRRRVSSALIAGEVATYEWDVHGDRLWGDANFDRIFGTTRDADGTAPLARFVQSIHPADRERVTDAVRQTVETGADYDTEYRIRTDGIERWVSARGRLAPADDRGVVRFHGVVLDITERKKAQQELELRTRLYDTFLSGTDDLAYLIDREGRFVFANRALLELWGMTAEQALGKTLYELGYPQWHADKNMREFAEIFATKKGLKGEVPYVSPTGVDGVYEYAFSPVLDAHGEVEFIAGTSRDVADRRKAEEIQRRLAAQLTLALEAARMGWWQYDIRTGRVFLDTRTMSIFGVTQHEHDLDAILARLVAGDAASLRNAMQLATDPHDPQPYEVEYRLEMSDGTLRWIVSKGLAIFDGDEDDRHAVAFVGTALDVTETKAAQEALHGLLESERIARTEAERASHMKDEFLATLSHELRTPLAAILGWAQILGAGATSAEELTDGIAVIARNARAQAQIIEDLLEMSRIVSGKIRLDVEPVELGSIVRAALATVQTAADAKGVRIAIHEDEHRLRISGDESRLHQVFWNLLSNAVKFTPAGGAIDVAIAHVASHVEVTVRDTGEGIHPDFLPYVFDRFRQADATTTRRHGGLGLGLAIVKQLVELHGGAVRVASAGIGKGTTFTVVLPVVALQQPVEPDDHVSERREKSVPHADVRIDGVKVLVLDDDEDARFVVLRFLESHGAIVAQATNVGEALSMLAKASYDVLVSDIGMPGEDGYSMIRKLRAGGNPIPAIALTAYARDTDRDRALAAGFQDHLPKPVAPAELIAAVAKLAVAR